MTKESIIAACEDLVLEDMAWVRRKLQDMVHAESARQYHERKACKHPHVEEQRYGQMEDQVHMVCTVCKEKLS